MNRVLRIRTQYDGEALQDYNGSKLEELRGKVREQLQEIKIMEICDVKQSYLDEIDRLQSAHLSRNDVVSENDAQIVLSRITDQHRRYSWDLYTLYINLDERGRTHLRNHYMNILESDREKREFEKLLHGFEEVPRYNYAVESAFSAVYAVANL
jgi:hypothetical protein